MPFVGNINLSVSSTVNTFEASLSDFSFQHGGRSFEQVGVDIILTKILY